MDRPGRIPDELDRAIIRLTQAGLPLIGQPYHALARELECTPELVMQRLRDMLQTGVIRRIGAVPNHYRLGYRANGMTVWDVPDEEIRRCGEMIGRLDFVSHCYRRPRHLPDWPYNLFAMVHGRTHEETGEHVQSIARLLGPCNRGHEVLYSTRILKKTGARLTGSAG